MNSFNRFSLSKSSTRISKTPSTSSSLLSTPNHRKTKTYSLHESLSLKQDLLSASLANYSKELQCKIPTIANKMSQFEMKLSKIRNKKSAVLKNLHLEKNYQKQFLISLRNIQNYQNHAIEMMMNVSENEEKTFKTKKKEEEISMLTKKSWDMEYKISELKNKLGFLKEKKTNLSAELVEIHDSSNIIGSDFYEQNLRKEENNISQEEITKLKEFISSIKNRIFSYLSSTNNIKKENSNLQNEIKESKSYLSSIESRNLERKREISDEKNKINAKTALMELENKFIDEQRRKYSIYLELVSKKIEKINKCFPKQSEKLHKTRIPLSTASEIQTKRRNQSYS
ncbi:hypothetical protein SteCoe_31332 [Stentor coeruleus]|uniref:Uncharacterized protein n=1 Tax=Stentor coeruleus TaxID=5963 RepID=A0A1R2B1J4_9CILI|nr:hypothetical protein SteCoe_31332 [Stentor coeruleus]